MSRIESLMDANTSLVVVNSPHNPTGATVSEAALRHLHDFAAARAVQLVCDEVFHPIYHGEPRPSASTLPRATVIGDLSKALALPGLRIGWIREPDAKRRSDYVNAREYLSISNTAAGELLAEIAIRHHASFHQRTQEVATANLAVLAAVVQAHSSFLAGPAREPEPPRSFASSDSQTRGSSVKLPLHAGCCSCLETASKSPITYASDWAHRARYLPTG